MIWLIAGGFLVLLLVVVALVLRISTQVNERLNQMGQTLQEANKIIGQNLGSANAAFGDVKEKLGKLEATNAQVLELTKNISSLQDLLRAPKFRGALGETLLENLLAQVLPKQHYTMQHRFKSGDSVDAVIRLGERLVPIDAKFSLENFQKMQEAPDEATKVSCRRKFIQDVKMRIDEISSKYILPDEFTYDFALMYIPAENVYYEVIIKEDIFSYCIAKKIIPVSPNTIYAYLQVICLGLKGLKIEENAKAILRNLGTLSIEINRFKEDFATLGSHLLNAQNKYTDSQQRLDKFSEKIANIQEIPSQPALKK